MIARNPCTRRRLERLSDDGLKLDPASQTQLLNYFRQHEPQFASDPSQFGMTMAVSYYNWLNGFASLSSNGHRDAADHIMLQSILDPMTDSRKVTAMLMSDSGPRLTALAHQEGNVQLMESKLQSALAGLRPGSGAYTAHLSMLNQLAQSSRSRTKRCRLDALRKKYTAVAQINNNVITEPSTPNWPPVSKVLPLS